MSTDSLQDAIAALGEIVPIDSVKVLTVQPGDVLVFQTTHPLSREQAMYFRQQVKAVIDLRCMVVTQAELAAVLRQVQS